MEKETTPSPPSTSPDAGTVVSAAPAQDTAALRKSILKKYDARILPVTFLAWTFFYLDRAAVALAKVNGMQEDLGLDKVKFNVLLLIFFVLYMLFNIPGNLVLRRMGGGRFLPVIIGAWGVVTTFTGFVKTYEGMCVARVFLGLTESAFLGAMMLYLGFFYTEFELVARVGIFYSGSALAGAIGGLLATGLCNIKFHGYNGWPWIYFVEGILTVILAVVSYLVLPNTPETAPFLTPEERVLAVERMLCLDRRHEEPDYKVAHPYSSSSPTADAEKKPAVAETEQRCRVGKDGHPIPKPDRLTWLSFKRAILNPVTLMLALATWLNIAALYSFSFFLPTIIAAMGIIDRVKLNLMTVPPNAAGFIFTILVTQYSQWSGRKAYPVVACSAVATLGYLLLLVGAKAATTNDLAIQYAGTFFVAIGINAIPPIALAWTSINASPHYVRAIVLGFMITFGNTASFLSSFTYLDREYPTFTTGHSINLACCVALTLLAAIIILYMRFENRKRDRGEQDYRIGEDRRGAQDKELFELELGWMHPRHRFEL